MEEYQLIQYISQKLIKNREKLDTGCMVVGIEGQGCSGKSTFAKKLKDAIIEKGYKADVVSIDDFCNKMAAI